MFTIRYFGQTYTGNGSIRQVLQAHNVNVDNQEPYINGNRVSMDHQPNAGETVNFRPVAAGKA